jgi:hypothetical protein
MHEQRGIAGSHPKRLKELRVKTPVQRLLGCRVGAETRERRASWDTRRRGRHVSAQRVLRVSTAIERSSSKEPKTTSSFRLGSILGSRAGWATEHFTTLLGCVARFEEKCERCSFAIDESDDLGAREFVTRS